MQTSSSRFPHDTITMLSSSIDQQADDDNNIHNHQPLPLQALITFRGVKVEIRVDEETTVGQVKADAIARTEPTLLDVKLIFQGKVLRDDDDNMYELLLQSSSSGKKSKKNATYRLMMSGTSSKESQTLRKEMEDASRSGQRIKDDLTDTGRAEMNRRKRLGRYMLEKSAAGGGGGGTTPEYGFGRIETLPGLPEEGTARQMLHTLANDPGILACMHKHRWNVGCLAELYPKGEVGVADVCVMGLNENHGQKILLRLRHEDFTGFRKPSYIRKVLYHELAHNVYSGHGNEFFQLMRQIERECVDLDWTNGAGLSSSDGNATSHHLYTGGTYRLGGDGGSGNNETNSTRPLREIAAEAAMSRMTAEEQEIQDHCGCCSSSTSTHDLFLPTNNKNSSSSSSPNDNKEEKRQFDNNKE